MSHSKHTRLLMYWILFISVHNITFHHAVSICRGQNDNSLFLANNAALNASPGKILCNLGNNQLAICTSDKNISVNDIQTGDFINEIRLQVGKGRIGEITSIGIDPINERLAVGRYGEKGTWTPEIYIIRLQKNGKKIERILRGHESSVVAVAFFDSGQKLFSIDKEGFIATWNLESGERIKTMLFPKELGVITGALLVKNSVVLGTSRGTLVNLSLGTMQILSKEVQAHGKSISGLVQMEHDRVASGGLDGSVKTWDVSNAQFQRLKQKDFGDQSNVRQLRFLPETKEILCIFGTFDNLAEKQDLKPRLVALDLSLTKERKIPLPLTSSVVVTLEIADDGRRAILLDISGGIQCVDLRNGKVTFSNPNQQRFLREIGFEQKSSDRSRDFRVFISDTERKDSTKKQFLSSFDLANRDFQNLASPSIVNDEEFEGRLVRPHTTQPRLIAVGSVNKGTINWEKKFEIDENLHDTAITTAHMIGKDSILIATPKGLFNFDPDGKQTWKSIEQPNVNSITITKDKKVFGTKAYDHIAIWKNVFPPVMLAKMYLFRNNEWAVVAPNGYFDCSPAAEQYLGWHENRGEMEFGIFHPLDDFKAKFFKPQYFGALWLTEDPILAEKFANLDNRRSLSESLGPVVKMIKPTGSQESDLGEIEVAFSVEPRKKDQSIDSVSLLINGGPSNYFREKKIGRLNKFNFALSAGEQRIAAKAESNGQFGVSSAVTISHYPPGSQKVPNRKLFFLGIGIDDFGNQKGSYERLTFAKSDVVAIGNTFKERAEGAFSEGSEILTPEIKSKDDVARSLKEFLGSPNKEGKFKQTDTLVVMWSGHGDVDTSGNFYLVTPQCEVPRNFDDSSLTQFGFNATELASLLRAYRATGGNVILMLDACKAGKGVEAIRDSQQALLRNTNDTHTGIMVIASASAEDSAKESKSLGMSNFAFLLQAGLLGKREFSVANKNVISDFSPYIEIRGENIVASKSLLEFLKRQLPILSNNTQRVVENGFLARNLYLTKVR